MLVYHFRHAARLRPVRHPFEHQRGGAAGQRAVKQVAVAGDPAYVGGAPVDVAGLIIEDIFKGGGDVNQITAGGVQHALRLAGRSRGIKDKQRIFRVHLFRLVVRTGAVHAFVPPAVAAVLPGDLIAGAFQHHHMLHAGDAGVF